MRRVFNILLGSTSGKLDLLRDIRVLNRDDILLHDIVRKTWVSTKRNLNLDKRENMTIGTFMISRFPLWLRCNWQTLKNSHWAIKSLYKEKQLVIFDCWFLQLAKSGYIERRWKDIIQMDRFFSVVANITRSLIYLEKVKTFNYVLPWSYRHVCIRS